MDSDFEFGWAVGFFEGEGSIWITKKTGQVAAAVTTSDLDALDRFVRFVGCGKIYPVKIENNSFAKKDQWTWRLWRQEDVRHLCKWFMPHLSERRQEQACKAIAQTERLRRPPGPAKQKRLGGFCKHGHRFTFANSYIRANGSLECKKCRRQQVKKHRSD